MGPFDVINLTDCRLPGGTSASVGEEIRAQSSAGFRTGLLHVPSRLTEPGHPFSEHLASCIDEGLAELIVGHRSDLEAKLLVIRHPSVFAEIPDDLPRVSADRQLMVANQTPTDRSGRHRFYEPTTVAANLERAFGEEVLWAPIGPEVRDSLAGRTGGLPLADEDWVNVIDVPSWAADRSRPAGHQPIIGRHGRDSWQKWPDNSRDLLAAYPASARVDVRILGGSETAERIIGGRPDNWEVLPFGSVPPRRFLAEIDFFVYFPHPDWVEAFGRTILEALASGAVAVLPDRFARLFGDACTYRDPAEVVATVSHLYDDWDAYVARSAVAMEVAAERFSYATHVRRLRALLGEPTSKRETEIERRESVPARQREAAGDPGSSEEDRAPVPLSDGKVGAGSVLKGPTSIPWRLRSVGRRASHRARVAAAGAMPQLERWIERAPAPVASIVRPLIERVPRRRGTVASTAVVMIVLEGQSRRRLGAIVDLVLRVRLMSGAFDAVFVTSASAASALEDRGVTYAIYTREDSDGPHPPPEGRVRVLVERRRPTHVLAFGEDATEGLIRGLLEAVAPH
jgi:hypothetical protein